MTVKIAGYSLSDNGALNMKASAAAVGSATRLCGIAFDTNSNQYNFDATAALPAGAFFFNGVAITPDGRICTTTGAPAVTTALKRGGIYYRADGAMHVTVAAIVAANVIFREGRAISALGALHIVAN